MSPLEGALSAAALGLRVFRCAPGQKVPLAKGWQTEATSDPQRLRRLWAAEPDANCGFAGGPMADGRWAIMLDADIAKGGLEALERMRQQGLPRTRATRSARDGRHLFFAVPAGVGARIGNSANRVPSFSGIDVRSGGGYVVGPGSTFEGRAYAWDDEVAIADAPDWLTELLQRATPPAPAPNDRQPLVPYDSDEAVDRATAYLRDVAPLAIEGAGGDHTTFAVACRVRDFGVSEATCFDLISVHWNEAGKASPPWMPDELQDKVRNAYRYAENPAGVALAAAEFDVVQPSSDLIRGKLVDLGRPTAYVPPEELVRDTVPAVGVGFTGGQSGGLKTFGTIDLSVCVATGTPFAGRLVEKPGAALYVAFEGRDTIAGRVLARRSLLADPDADIPLIALNDFGSLATEKDRNAFRQTLLQIRDYAAHRWNVPLRLIAIDTVTAAGLIGEDQENDPAAWQRHVFDFFNPIAAKMQLAIVLVHHFGKTATAGLRGSSNARAGADFVLVLSCDRNEVTGETANHFLSLSKSRTGAEGPIAAISKRPVEIGRRADGSIVTTLVLEFDVGQRPASPTRRKLTRAAQTFLTAATLALEEHGETIVVGGAPRRAVRRSVVRAAFVSAYKADDPEATPANLRQQFSRATKDMPGGWAAFEHDGDEWISEAVFDGSEFDAIEEMVA